MNKSKQIRREIGLQFGIIRRKKHVLLQKVADDTGLSMTVLDEIEMGIARSWLTYHRLKEYYHCEIKVIEKE